METTVAFLSRRMYSTSTDGKQNEIQKHFLKENLFLFKMSGHHTANNEENNETDELKNLLETADHRNREQEQVNFGLIKRNRLICLFSSRKLFS